MVQLELGEEIESRLVKAASDSGVTLTDYILVSIEPMLPVKLTPEQLAERQASVESMRTFAQDHGFTLPPGVTIRDIISESRR